MLDDFRIAYESKRENEKLVKRRKTYKMNSGCLRLEMGSSIIWRTILRRYRAGFEPASSPNTCFLLFRSDSFQKVFGDVAILQVFPSYCSHGEMSSACWRRISKWVASIVNPRASSAQNVPSSPQRGTVISPMATLQIRLDPSLLCL